MSKFNFIKTDIPDVQIIEPTVFGDDRGYFMETYQIDEFAAAGIDKPFVQDNQSRLHQGRAARPALPDKAHPGQARPRDPWARCSTSPSTAAPTARPSASGVGRNAVRRQQEDALDPRGLRPRLCRAVRCGRVLLQVHRRLRPHRRGPAFPTMTRRSTCSGPTAAASTRPALRTRSTPRLPPRSSNILRNIEG